MEMINSVIKQLVGIGLALIPLVVVLFLLVGGPLPFFGAVVDNLIDFIKTLGEGGPIGFLVAAFIIWLLASWALPRTGFAGPDDLKRISGVGPAIEAKLNALGVTLYGEIANWSAADIRRVDDELNFHGRIARDDWVGQAKILAAGDETEFSRRYES